MPQRTDYEWTYDQICSDAFAQGLMDQISEMQGTVLLHLSDGDIIVGVRQAYLNLIYWKIPRAFGIPIQKKYYCKHSPINKGTMAKGLNIFYDEIVKPNPRNAKKFKEVEMEVNQFVYTFCGTRLLDYVATIDIIDMAEVMNDDQVKKINYIAHTVLPDQGIPYVERVFDQQAKALMKLLGTPGAIENPCLTNYQRLGYLNKFQVPQVMTSYGVRTDIDDTIISAPVYANAIDGLHDIQDFVIEHTSAKKAQVYNKVGVRQSQYFGRKQHLVCSVLHKIYPGDCGSTQLVKFHVTEKNCHALDGATIYIDGKSVELTASSARQFINMDVYKRSAMTCRHTDGVCEACAGALIRNIYPKLNVGMVSAIQVIEPVTQKILSAKHLIKTNTLVFHMDISSIDVMRYNGTANLYWTDKVKEQLVGCWLGIDSSEFHRFDRVMNIKPDASQIGAKSYSRVTHFYLRKGDLQRTCILSENPEAELFLSPEMLMYIRNHIEECYQSDDGIIWVPMDNSRELPVFTMVVVNDNMLQFVKSCDNFLHSASGLRKSTSCSDALQRFSDLVHSKVELNLTHIEVLLKAYMITSRVDYRIPIVQDPDHVMFASYDDILTNRAIGTKLAFEKIYAYLTDPTTYLLPKQSGVLDNFTIGS